MKSDTTPEIVDSQFFAALLGADAEALVDVLAEDFALVDVFTGSVVPGSVLLDLVGGRQLRFTGIDLVERSVRHYPGAAIIVGHTRMAGLYEGAPFEVESRYTHVFVRIGEAWRMASAQGTPIAASQPAA